MKRALIVAAYAGGLLTLVGCGGPSENEQCESLLSSVDDMQAVFEGTWELDNGDTVISFAELSISQNKDLSPELDALRDELVTAFEVPTGSTDQENYTRWLEAAEELRAYCAAQ